MSQWLQAIGEEASQRIKETPIDTINVKKKCNGQADSHQPSTCCVVKMYLMCIRYVHGIAGELGQYNVRQPAINSRGGDKLFRVTLRLDRQSRALEFSKQRMLYVIRLRVEKIWEAQGIATWCI